MGRKPNQLISAHFKRGQKLDNSSNRYEQTCIHCARAFPKGRPEVLTSHLSKCPALSPATRINILNQPDTAQPPARSELDQNYNPQHNVGLQQLADVAEAAGAATMRAALPVENTIPLDPQLSAPSHHQNGNPIVVPQFGDHHYYHPAAPYTAADDDARATSSSSSSIYPSLIGPAITSESSQYPPFPGIAAPSFPNAFGQYTTSSHIPSILANSLPPVGAGADFDEFVPVSNDSIPHLLSQPNSLGPIDPSFAQQTPNGATEQHDATSIRSASKPRKAKEPYSADQRKKIADVRRVKPCIRCSRLQKSCSISKPCSECLKVQTSKNWVGPCTKFRNSNEFDEWYQSPIHDQLIAHRQQIESEYTFNNDTRYIMEVRLADIISTPITFEIIRATGADPEGAIWVLDDSFDLKTVMIDYLQVNVEAIIHSIDQPELLLTLERAQGLTKGKKIALSKVVPGQQLDGDDNLRQLINLWIAVYLLSTHPWIMSILDSDGNPVPIESEQSLMYINLKIDAGLESIIGDSRTGPVPPKDGSEEPDFGGPIHEFDVTRISSSGHKEFHNLLIGIIIMLSAVERYCAITRAHLGTLPPDHREKAEEYARKYVYAVRGISILPQLVVDSAGGHFVIAKQDVVVTTANTGKRTLNYSLTKAYVDGLRLRVEELQARNASINQEWTGNMAAWDGWLWSLVFLAMIE